MDIHYSRGWFRAKKRPNDLWTEHEAKAAYDRRELHTAIAGPLNHPIAFIEFNKDYVGVGFLDHLLREYLSYQFQELRPGQLFLTMATHRDFDGDSDSVSSGTTYIFNPDGKVTLIAEDFRAGSKTQGATESNVSGNWENYPLFGKYELLLRTERESKSGK
jgi:hypothetical protein